MVVESDADTPTTGKIEFWIQFHVVTSDTPWPPAEVCHLVVVSLLETLYQRESLLKLTVYPG